MADALVVQHSVSGATVYALIRDSAGDVWNGAAFEAYLTANLSTYDVAMTEQGTASRLYAATVPALATGLYSVIAFVRAGGSPAETDTAIGAGEIDWDGAAFYTLDEVVSNSVTPIVSLIGVPAAGTVSQDIVNLSSITAGLANIVVEIQRWLRLLFRSDAAIATDYAAELADINANEGNGAGSFVNTTDSLQAIAAAGGGLDAAGVRAAVGLASANLDTQLGDLPTNAELAASQAAADDATLAAIGAGGAGLSAIPWNASWDAEVQSEVADALEATIADSVPADGTIPSVKQALYMLTQFMLERSVVGTTATIKKADGTTTLLTLTLNSATAPTSVTRAT